MVLPIALSKLVTAAVAVAIGMPFNYANIIALPLLVGFGVDSGIHVVHRMQTDTAEQFFDTSAMRAVLASGLTIVASFGMLAFSAHVGTASMGKMLTIGLCVSVAFTLIALPAWLKVRGARARSACASVSAAAPISSPARTASWAPRLCERCSPKGSAVRAFVRPHSDRRNLEDLDVEIAEGDLNDAASLREAARGCGAVFHVAADYRLWVADPAPMYKTNVDGSVNVLEAAAEAGVERVVYTSSVAVSSNFTGGAIGSAAGSIAWSVAGWGAVCGVGVAFAGIAMLLWLTEPGHRAKRTDGDERRVPAAGRAPRPVR